LRARSFSSFVEAHGQPLLDLSLYVSSENYASATRPAYAPILPWPGQWLTPPDRRAAARARTTHLGLSSLDLDTPDPASKRNADHTPGSDSIPASLLRRPRETVTSLLSSPQRRNNIHLHTLTRTFLQPLQELLGKKKFFFGGDRPSSLDCLAVGYLALALYPDLPQPWLAEIMRTDFGRLGGYVHNLVGAFFGGSVSVEQALGAGIASAGLLNKTDAERHRLARERGLLPWKAPERGGLWTIGSLVLENVLDSVPLVDQLRASNRLSRAARESNLTEEEKKQVRAVAAARRRELFSQVLAVGAGFSAFVGYLFYNGIVSFSTSEEEEAVDKRSLADMGEAGAMLAMANYTAG
jgi:sorting and assembly machinery component 37